MNMFRSITHAGTIEKLSIRPMIRVMGCAGRGRVPRGVCACAARFLVVLASVLLVACGSGPEGGADPGSVDAARMRAILGDGRSGAASSPTSGEVRPWAIVVGRIADGRRGQSDQILSTYRTSGGLPGARLAALSGAVVVVTGAYSAADEPDAQADLRAIKALEVDGRTPYVGARLALVEPVEALARAEDPLDLRNARRLHGEDAVYTLQIAIFRREDGRQPTSGELSGFRRRAEARVAELRRDGVEAFYYHAPTSSTVTVGLFREDEFRPGSAVGTGGGLIVSEALPATYSPRLTVLRERFPENLVNGRPVPQRARFADGTVREVAQSSFIVRVPTSR